MKHITIHTPTIDHDSDFNTIAKRVMAKCKYIPEKWIDKVTDALRELQQKNRFQISVTDAMVNNDNWEDIISDTLEKNLELLYGEEDEKQISLNETISLCKEPGNLRFISNHHPLMSALSRILSDKGSSSRKIVFLVVKIFLAFAEFEDFHQILSKYRVGLLIVNTINLEIMRTDQFEKDSMIQNIQDGSMRSDNILFLCFQILTKLSDNEGIMRKMLKKNLAPMLVKALRSSSRSCVESILTLMIRATGYEEVVHECNKNKCTILQLVRLLISQDENISMKALRVLYNLSFDYECLRNMLEADIIDVMMKSNQRKMTKKHFFGILYHLSCFDDIRQSLDFNVLIPPVFQYVLSSPKEGINPEMGAFIINVSKITFIVVLHLIYLPIFCFL